MNFINVSVLSFLLSDNRKAEYKRGFYRNVYIVYSYMFIMVTTIQVEEKTLLLLKKLKESLDASSYDEAITKIAIKHMKPEKSMAGSLGKYFKNYSTEKMVKEMQEERRKFDR